MKKYHHLTKPRLLFILALLSFLVLGAAVCILRTKRGPELSPYPYGKNFAFTITSDPDHNRLEEIRPIYDFLDEIGMRTTIAVWTLEQTRSTGLPDVPMHFDYGDTCERKEYLDYMKKMQKRGFEIALHGASGGNDYREKTIEGYEKFRAFFGHYPKINIMHCTNLENIYWGKKTVSNGLLRYMLGMLSKNAALPFAGEEPGSKYFWGDIVKEKTKYVRMWGTSDINTLKFNPSMPYHNPKKPYVNYWFSFSNGVNVNIFNSLVSDKNIERLVEERGACIVYVHFACGFFQNGVINQHFREQLTKLAQKSDGWFVPASVLLDRLLLMKNMVLRTTGNRFSVVNLNDCAVDGVTVLVRPNEVIYFGRKKMKANHEGEIVLGRIEPIGSAVRLESHYSPRNEYPGILEYANMVFQRSIMFLKARWTHFKKVSKKTSNSRLQPGCSEIAK